MRRIPPAPSRGHGRRLFRLKPGLQRTKEDGRSDMLSRRPHVLAVLPHFIPSAMITVVKPMLNLHRAGRIAARIVLEPQAGRRDLDWADAVVFCRNSEPRYRPFLAAARARGVPTIYDLDDNLLELPPDCEGSSQVRETSRQAMIEEYLGSASLVRVYSPLVAERVAAMNERVTRIVAPVDLSLVPADEKPRPRGPIRIVYATSRTHDALCEIFLPALAQILEPPS